MTPSKERRYRTHILPGHKSLPVKRRSTSFGPPDFQQSLEHTSQPMAGDMERRGRLRERGGRLRERLRARTGLRLRPRTGLRLRPRTGLRLRPRTGLRLRPRTGLRLRSLTGDWLRLRLRLLLLLGTLFGLRLGLTLARAAAIAFRHQSAYFI